MACEICGRKADSRYCELHEQAYANLVKNYDAWKKAMSTSWLEYLKEIQKNPLAGVWVREVAENLLASSSSGNESVLSN